MLSRPDSETPQILTMDAPAAAVVPARRRSSKRVLLFDNRYGWIFDEWREPSVEALAGGRGMFCVLPIAKALFNVASPSALNVAAGCVVRAIGNHNQVSSQAVDSNLSDWCQKIMESAQRADLKLLILQRDCSLDWTRAV